MKKLNYLFLSVIAVVFLTLVSCGDDDPGVTPIEAVKERLAGTWAVDASNTTSKVLFGTEDRTDGYTNFALTFNLSGLDIPGGSYTTTLVDEPDPWPSSGTWTFTNPDNITDPAATTFQITRGDGVVIDVNLTETTLELNFSYDQSVHAGDDNRIKAVDGEWTFVLVKQN
ncbi:MAG: hypothetical protein ACNS60_01135 [Candidatus Cyclobacteriaceae bacterium M2_1C_046]